MPHGTRMIIARNAEAETFHAALAAAATSATQHPTGGAMQMPGNRLITAGIARILNA